MAAPASAANAPRLFLTFLVMAFLLFRAQGPGLLHMRPHAGAILASHPRRGKLNLPPRGRRGGRRVLGNSGNSGGGKRRRRWRRGRRGGATGPTGKAGRQRPRVVRAVPAVPGRRFARI